MVATEMIELAQAAARVADAQGLSNTANEFRQIAVLLKLEDEHATLQSNKSMSTRHRGRIGDPS
jgi:hypothetical protein